MLLGGRSVSPLHKKIKTPTRQMVQSKSPIRKQASFKVDPKATAAHNKAQQKTKQTMGILYSLEEIYNQLNFNQFDAFAQERIIEARKNVDRLCTFFKDQPICPKHQDLLNLYCENDKEVICVSCMFKGNQQHKNHKIKPLETVQKTLQYEITRNLEKGKSLVHQLTQIQDEIKQIEKEICDNFMHISSNSLNIINETITELETLKQEYDSKLSLAYRRTITIVKRYNDSVDLMINFIDSNLQKASTMKGLGKYLLLKQINKESALMEQLINKFNENRVLMQQWKRSMKETERIMVKKKKQKFRKQDVYVVTQF